MNTPDSSSSTSHLFSIKSDLLPGYIPVRVASKILFVGESIQMFQEKGKSAVSRGKSKLCIICSGFLLVYMNLFKFDGVGSYKLCF
jgi:hypothetical protein